MKKGRSNYTFQLSCDTNLVNGIIQNYLTVNGFKLTVKNGEQYYESVDSMMGCRGFAYSFQGQNLYILVWLIGAFGDLQIEQNSLNMPSMDYRNSLITLFNEISNLNNQYQQNISNNQMNNNSIGQHMQSTTEQINNPNQFTQTFQNETIKKQEKMCEIGFWLSLFGVLSALVGIAYGIFVYIMNFYFASQGLKTKKKNKAIATIILSIVSIIIIIVQLISL